MQIMVKMVIWDWLDDLTWQLELALALEQEEVDLHNLGSAHLLIYEGLITNAHDLEA